MATTQSLAGSMPVRQIAPVVLMIFANFFGQNLIFPFLPFMVKDFLHVPRNKVGFYSGFLASAYHFGSFIGSLMWGAAADRFGRRPTLLTSVSLTMIWMLLFGFSQSFSWAVITRFLWGLSSAVVSIGKTVLSESATSSSMARTFSLMGVAGGLGRLLGPAIGGMLVGIIPDFPYILPLLICLFMTAISFVLGFIFIKETLVKANKPLPRQQSQDSSLSHEHLDLVQTSENSPTSNGYVLRNGSVNTSNIAAHDQGHKSNRNSWNCCLCPMTAAPYEHVDKLRGRYCNSCCKNIVKALGDYVQLLKDRAIRTACTVYAMLAVTAIMHNELIPLVLVVNFAHGGLCLNSAEIGIIFAIVGIFQLFIQLLLYPQLSKHLSYRRIFQAGMIGLAMCMIIFPWIPTFTGNQDPVRAMGTIEAKGNLTDFHSTPPDWSNNSNWLRSFSEPPTTFLDNVSKSYVDVTSSGQYRSGGTQQTFVSTNASVGDNNICLLSKAIVGNDTDECGRPLASSGKSRTVNYKLIKCLGWKIWVIVLIIVGAGYWIRTISFTSVNILLNNSCEMEVRARVNGIGMTMSAIGRIFGPIIISNMFAVSDTNSPNSTFTVEHHLTAWITAISAIIAALWCLRLPASVEKKKVATSAELDITHPSPEEEELTLVDGEDEDTELSEEHAQLVRNSITNNHELETSM